MQFLVKHNLRAGLVACLVLFMVACGTDDKSKNTNNQNNENNVNNVNNSNNINNATDMDLDSQLDQDGGCDDGTMNGDETDIDCGGSCAACDVGETCKIDSDCQTDRCDAGACAEPLVELGGECVSDEECESGSCLSLGGQDFCTTACTDTCAGADLACFQDQCVPNSLCIDPDQDGYGDGPGCTGTPCDRCDAAATCTEEAEGTFTCTCDAGYTGDGFTCDNVDECADGSAGCDTNAACTDTPGSFNCVCNAGFEGDGTICTNIDECSGAMSPCDVNADCADSDGSYTCTCRSGFGGDGVTCTNIDECATGAALCDTNATCQDSPGSFTCTCSAGYQGDGTTCANIDECATNQDNCGANTDCQDSLGSFTCACSTGYQGDPVAGCTDTNECALNQDNCGANAECTNTPGSFACACSTGYEGDPVAGCTNIDECASGTACGANAICIDTDPGFACACGLGYQGDPYAGCTDVDECALNTDTCVANSDCTNVPGNFSCTCASGFAGNGYTQCDNIDECALNQDNCDTNAACTDTSGSFTCACNVGYTGDGVSCILDGDFCANAFAVGALPFTGTGDTTDASSDYGYSSNTCPGETNGWGAGSNDVVWYFTPTTTGNYAFSLDATFDSTLYILTDCTNTNTCLAASETVGVESFSVLLTQGVTYFVIVDGFGNTSNQNGPYTLTVDVDECADGTDTCPAAATCNNTLAGFDCVCNPGYALVGTACVDIDECATNQDDCDAQAVCTNTPGSFSCACPAPLIGDGQNCHDPTALGESCTNPYIVGALPYAVTNYTTADNGPDYGFGSNSCPGVSGSRGAGSNDEVFQFTAPADGQYTFQVAGQFDATLYVVTDCADINNTCLGADDSSFSSGTETVVATLTASQVVYVVVDGWSDSSNNDGSYDFTVTSP